MLEFDDDRDVIVLRCPLTMGRDAATMQDMPHADNMDATIRVRISSGAIAAWRRAAEADHRSLSAWIRMRCEGFSATDPIPSQPYTRQGSPR